MMAKRKLQRFIKILCIGLAFIMASVTFIYNDVYQDKILIIDSQQEKLYIYVNDSAAGSSYNNEQNSNYLSENICYNITRPTDSDINLRNNFWHFFQHETAKVYIFGAYLDQRDLVKKPGVIRLFPLYTIPVGIEPALKSKVFHLLLWYNGLTNPVVTTCNCYLNKTNPWHGNHNLQYGNMKMECPMPENGLLPDYVSLIYKYCDKPHTFVKLTKPEKPRQEDFGVCVKAIYGNFTKDSLAYLVSWLETLKLFGIKHVHMYYDALIMDNTTEYMLSKAIDYYKEIGFFTFEHLPNNLYETDSPFINAQISQSVVPASNNDCFYRNLYKFAFIKSIDFDEILIPHKHLSYKELFSDYFGTNILNISNSQVISHSAYFYYNDYPVGNPSAPEYIPLLRLTYRTPAQFGYQHTTNWYTWGLQIASTGVQKAFYNTKSCITMGIHGGEGIYKPGDYLYNQYKSVHLQPDLILNHHYRGSCKVSARCEFEWYRRINDFTIPDKIGSLLTKRVEFVLDQINYFN